MPDPFGSPDLLQIFSQSLAFLQQSIQNATQTQLQLRQLKMREQEMNETYKLREENLRLREENAAEERRQAQLKEQRALESHEMEKGRYKMAQDREARAAAGKPEIPGLIPTEAVRSAEVYLRDIKREAAAQPLPEPIAMGLSGPEISATSDELARIIAAQKDQIAKTPAWAMNLPEVTRMQEKLRSLEGAYQSRSDTEKLLINQRPAEVKALLDLIIPVNPAAPVVPDEGPALPNAAPRTSTISTQGLLEFNNRLEAYKIAMTPDKKAAFKSTALSIVPRVSVQEAQHLLNQIGAIDPDLAVEISNEVKKRAAR